MSLSHRSMSVAEIAAEALHHLTFCINRSNKERARLKEEGLPDDYAVHFDNATDRQAFEATGKNFWKEVKLALTERELTYTPAQIISEHIAPAMHCLEGWLYQRENHSPLGPLPVCEMDGLEMAVAHDPETGHAVRVRRWNSATSEREWLAFEICSRDYQPQDALVGPFLTA